MVFGFGEGSIELMLDKTLMNFGEQVHGKLKLKLKKEKKAKQLRVRVLAERTQTQYGGRVSSSGRKSNNTQRDVVFSTDIIVDGEKTYVPPGQDYDVKIQIPAKTALPSDTTPELGGGLGTAIKAAQMLGGVGRSTQIKWFVEATLDIPGGRDIGKKVQITVQ